MLNITFLLAFIIPIGWSCNMLHYSLYEYGMIKLIIICASLLFKR